MNKQIIAGLAGLAVIIGVVAVALGMARQPVEEPAATPPQADQPTAATTGDAETSVPAGQTASVEMTGSQFQPRTLTVKKGTTVTWTNRDAIQHNVTSADGKLPALNGPLLARGETYSFTFDTVGTFEYLCEPHRSSMRATVVVTD